MTRRTSLAWLTLGPAIALASSCGGNPELIQTGSTTGTTGQGGAGAGGNGSGGEGNVIDLTTAASTTGAGGSGGQDIPPACGDGKVDPGEACDDGNGVSADGCTGNCDAIENGFACPVPGMACVSTVICGDAEISGGETCDDQNTSPGDGCDATCHVEPGWQCVVIGAACEAAACGDGIVAGDEECEDGDALPGDGCDATCQLEPGFVCDVPAMPCVPTVCGDGIAEGSEQCDDGDNDMGDGCSPFCVSEPQCLGIGACTSSCGDGIKLPNGTEQCEDGNTEAGDGCSPTCEVEPGFACQDASVDPNQLILPIVLRDFSVSHPDMEDFLGSEQGIVAGVLGANGKPVYANPGGTTATTSGQANFDQWYSDVPGVNVPIVQTITLTKLPGGEFQYDNGNFFPLNGLGFGNEGNGNNFHFTSEVRYWFEYKGTEVLSFTGDDDVWVFVNKQLAVDLGGVHGAQSGGVTLASQAGQLGLAVGSIYEIVVFQAERHTTQSNYKLTLGDFVNATSVCASVCGDGIKTPDEVCDDGTNDGSYGSCTPDCLKGPYCGDAMVQAGFEECDDGVNLSPYGGCAPGCVPGAFCGDGQVDSLFGEQCDDAVNDGGYEQCAAGCLLGPRCGDGVVEPGVEECDDGDKQNGDGCSAACTVETPD